MIEVFSLPFMQRALIAGAMTAIPLALLGILVTARGMAFFGDGVAHASLAGIAIGFLVGVNPLWTALVVAVLFAILMVLFERYSALKSDTLLGFLFTIGLALGIVLMSLQTGYQPDLIGFLFGNILTIGYSDLLFIIPFSIVTTVVLLVLYRGLVLMTLNREMAWLSGIPTIAAELLLYILLAITVVIGVKLLGIVLISALLILPVATGRLLARSLTSMVVHSMVFAEVIVIGGLLASYYLDLPSGAIIVLWGAVLFTIVLASAKLRLWFVK